MTFKAILQLAAAQQLISSARRAETASIFVPNTTTITCGEFRHEEAR